jgi:hypothetical protein
MSNKKVSKTAAVSLYRLVKSVFLGLTLFSGVENVAKMSFFLYSTQYNKKQCISLKVSVEYLLKEYTIWM